MLINADCGGSNGARLRLWKRELQVLADELGIEITVSHCPPGTSKWNKIEHRLFSFITQNWRGKPLVSYLVIVQLIASTTTDTGLTVACRLDENDYEKGIKVTDAEMATLNIHPPLSTANGTYTIAPRPPDGRCDYSGSGTKQRAIGGQQRRAVAREQRRRLVGPQGQRWQRWRGQAKRSGQCDGNWCNDVLAAGEAD